MALTFSLSFNSFFIDFGVNKYYGELLNIGKEYWPEVRHENDDDDSDERLNELVAQAHTHLEVAIYKIENHKSGKERKRRSPATGDNAAGKKQNRRFRNKNSEYGGEGKTAPE
jgi:hypothetical protein